VALTRGEARFRVERNDRVPFYVSAAGVTAKATGTEFSMRLVNSERVEVLVEEGRVAISVPALQATFSNMFLSSPGALTVSAGESISLQSNALYAREKLSPAVLKRRTAWADRWIWFSAEPLPEAVAEFNRYHDQQLVLVDPRLASLEIGGRFRSNDLDSFIATLEHSFDVRATASADHGTGAATIYLSERCLRAQQQCN
jgi:transmembrane sensor